MDNWSTTISVSRNIFLQKLCAQDTNAVFELIDRNREHLSCFGENIATRFQTRDSVHQDIVTPEEPSIINYGIWFQETYKGFSDQREYLGSINVRPNKIAKAMIGCYLGEKYQKQGIMTRAISSLASHAFEQVNLRELIAKVHKENSASAKVLERVGFSKSKVEIHPLTHRLYTLKNPHSQNI